MYHISIAMNAAKKTIERLIDGTNITINGSNEWDIQVINDDLYARILRHGSIGLGEAYMEGWWECAAPDELFSRVLQKRLDRSIPFNFTTFLQVARARVFNQQSRDKAREAVMRHYDIGNDLYQQMLDKRMIYSCAYWEDVSNLDEAQEKKLDLICRKLKLSSGQRLLDIGCGWGGLAQYAAERYGVSVTGITLSEPQALVARENCRGLPVEIRVQDYRDLHEKFDRIVSVGMFEHVGYKNYASFMKVAEENLLPDGIFLLHTIGGNETVTNIDPWINKYIFPNSVLPSLDQINKANAGRFIMEDLHNFGAYYDRTLMAWLSNFERAWQTLSQRYDNTFFRMWKYYLCMSAATFRSKVNDLWQIVWTLPSYKGVYESVRR
ncbi:MAG TPA: cyclopropane fatty acyl phospholipid synthase [Chitinophaga sp.]|uniref:cyclopropane fatty acyl phospholipid synthase n=1 Tax=Chitinophaga sp. TaxID=1869181 RepID=UPI002C2D3DE3|nr:cyclopropane fatty acyl phospholipid synthase [Chitinophaga sp.]HVI43720.1 cyclopropane fatty acyl phospholipid synthase [Chitinophaga sp.]